MEKNNITHIDYEAENKSLRNEIQLNNQFYNKVIEEKKMKLTG